MWWFHIQILILSVWRVIFFCNRFPSLLFWPKHGVCPVLAWHRTPIISDPFCPFLIILCKSSTVVTSWACLDPNSSHLHNIFFRCLPWWFFVFHFPPFSLRWAFLFLGWGVIWVDSTVSLLKSCSLQLACVAECRRLDLPVQTFKESLPLAIPYLSFLLPLFLLKLTLSTSSRAQFFFLERVCSGGGSFCRRIFSPSASFFFFEVLFAVADFNAWCSSWL